LNHENQALEISLYDIDVAVSLYNVQEKESKLLMNRLQNFLQKEKQAT
jgi:hypothetical protein